MTAPLFVADAGAVAAAQLGDQIGLDGPEGRHAVAVTRIGVGERILLCDGRGTLLEVDVTAVEGRDALRGCVVARVSVPAAEPRIVVVQALPKGERGETAVETLTEVGVDVIVPWQAQRSIARWSPERAARGRQKWAATALAAAKQSRRAWFPEVGALASGREVTQRVRAAALAVVLHEEAERSLAGITLPESGDIVLVVGPEGGISPDELAAFTEAGAVLGRLGPTVLRASTAGTVAAGVVLSATSRWA